MAAFLDSIIMSNGRWQEQDYEDRWLAGEDTDAGYDTNDKKEDDTLDYSVLSVGVMTLGLIMMVEVIRHKLDYEAQHRPFYKVVLEAAYSELATLGLVELFVFWLIRYYGMKNKARKQVFAEVHFALFYTAIFNVFQSVICAFATRAVSKRMWVQTEHFELDHYVEIREEFDRVSLQYHLSHRGNSMDVFRNIWSAIQNPGLRSRYLELLVQVRFHQLRVQFLETNALPLNLKVSDYLKRSEEAVLMQMVHVSGTAWLLLTGAFSLIYFLMGIVVNQTGNGQIVGLALSAIFFSVLFLFIFICIVLYVKMREIFQDILEMKHIQETDHDAGAQHQLRLFWFNEPQLVIALIQFMQFGYAIALATVLMFWNNLGEVEPYYYLIATLGCYAIFVYVLAKVLPQFTLCTSLGHLVNKERLNETLAFHRFHEAQRRQTWKRVQLTFGQNLDDSLVCVQESAATTNGDERMASVVGEIDPPSLGSFALGSKCNGVPGLFEVDQSPSLLLPRPASAENMISSISQSWERVDSFTSTGSPSKKSILLADLVKMDTSLLRRQLPESDQNRMMQRQQQIKSRRSNRRKSVSEGVQAMRDLGLPAPPSWTVDQAERESNITDAADSTIDATEQARQHRLTRLANRRSNRRKSVSASDVIQSWRSLEEDGSSSSTRVPRKAPLAQIVEGQRHCRQKSVSNPDAIQSWQLQPQHSTEDGVNFFLKHPIMNQQKSTDDPAIRHRQLRTERMSQERKERRRTKSLSASAVIESWQNFPMTDSPAASKSNSLLEESFFVGSDTRMEDNETESKHDRMATALGMISNDGDNLDKQDEMVTVVNLADASLMAPRTRKSVVFLTLDNDDHNSESSLIQKQNNDDPDDDSTVDTGKSVGELSDVGQITQRELESMRSLYWEESWRVKLRKRISPSTIKMSLRAFFVTGHYDILSHVFGSITVFFLIGQRLEAFNAVTGIYTPSDNTWEFKLNVAFWWQATWYMFFLIMAGLVMWSVHPSECKSIPEKRALTAAWIDIFLSTLCMTLLFVAESLRCCNEETPSLANGGRHLLSLIDNTTESDVEKSTYTESSVQANDNDIYSQCCPFWGYRTYGGYGKIEPFTALIGLRVMRFYIAKYLVRLMAKKESDKDPASIATTEEHNSKELRHGHIGGHNHGHVEHESGTAVELWQRAISKHPEIAEKYGQFSAELLQTMLGLEIFAEDDHAAKSVASINQAISLSTSTRDLQAPEVNEEDNQEKSNQPHYKLNGEQYSSLSAESQRIILAGKLGKPVRSMGNLMEHFTSVRDLPALHEDSAVESDHFPAKPSTSLEFEVDGHLLAEEENADSEFIAPNARLIRSMRRCERILYPLLKEWTPVDVVITNYEIVYFEVETESVGNLSPGLDTQKEALRTALAVTKGGMGLRLMDVAAGRKVVGHLDLADITQVHVERHMPLLDVSHLEREEQSLDAGKNQPASEYWQKSSHLEVHHQSRKLRWAKVKEDRLKIVSIHGTLLLRYFSDLNDVEAHIEASGAEDELFGPLKKDIALQWAQTLAHICGTDQLKQSLPNFGRNDSEELRDYLEVIHHKAAETKHRRGSSAFMLNSAISTRALITPHDRVSSPIAEEIKLPKPKLRYSRSLGDAVLERTPIPLIFRRGSSTQLHDQGPSRPRTRSENALEDIETGNTPKKCEENFDQA